MARRYETAVENRAYTDGYTRGIQATGHDWAIVRVKLIEVEENVKRQLAAKDEEIRRLRRELDRQREFYESEIIDRESHIEALKIAWKHRKEGDD